ncbi:MAG: ATP-binding cassette domain-containing protein, partial [Candidatus Cloacimonadota bacterium]|nr:ATP-binding cassette domain-containing protein [Candidatus Cloacimonadota bacterium]
KVPANDIIRRIDNVLAKLDIEDLRHKETASLSFGQKKLVTLASILTLSPNVYLLDEPFAGLSQKYIKLISDEIKTLADNGKIIFLAGHTNDIAQFANKTIEMEELNEVH